MKTVGYIRVSTEEQAWEGVSLYTRERLRTRGHSNVAHESTGGRWWQTRRHGGVTLQRGGLQWEGVTHEREHTEARFGGKKLKMKRCNRLQRRIQMKG